MRYPEIGTGFVVVAAIFLINTGCGTEFVFSGLVRGDSDANGQTGLVTQIAEKAAAIGERIGGENGFGGEVVDGYLSHMEDHMGFHGLSDLADPDGRMTVVLRNESEMDSSFDVVYVTSRMGIEEQIRQVRVLAGEETTVEIPCSEIVGLGSLTSVGETAVRLSDGAEFENTMCVPAFLGSDYRCGDAYLCFFGVDTEDVDADGDAEELIVITEALELHTGPNGMRGHGHMMVVGK